MTQSEALQEARRRYIEEAIADITQQLKGPVSNVERAWLVADRKEFRAELAAFADADQRESL